MGEFRVETFLSTLSPFSSGIWKSWWGLGWKKKVSVFSPFSLIHYTASFIILTRQENCLPYLAKSQQWGDTQLVTRSIPRVSTTVQQSFTNQQYPNIGQINVKWLTNSLNVELPKIYKLWHTCSSIRWVARELLYNKKPFGMWSLLSYFKLTSSIKPSSSTQLKRMLVL